MSVYFCMKAFLRIIKYVFVFGAKLESGRVISRDGEGEI